MWQDDIHSVIMFVEEIMDSCFCKVHWNCHAFVRCAGTVKTVKRLSVACSKKLVVNCSFGCLQDIPV